MHFINIRNTKIPALGFGTWKLSGSGCTRAVSLALDLGYRHIDTAQIYENEAEIGKAIAPASREEIFLTTKVWKDNLRNGDLQKSVDVSLKKLKTDYVDLLLIHWPVTTIPFSEQIKALTEVQKSGRARLIGVSNFTVAQMREVVESLGAPIVNNQIEYHPFLSQQSVLSYARQNGIFITAYCPLARGGVEDNETIEELARQYGKTPGQITLRWLMQQDNVAAIPKAASENHIRDNFNIFDFALSDADMRSIDALARPDGRLVNPEDAPVWDKAA